MSFAREWNHFTAKRRGLGRNLTGRRTKIYLLQLSTHFAATLTITFGVLHWLLSQSLLLILLEARK